jgi:phytoene dehydrogenase-like protein
MEAERRETEWDVIVIGAGLAGLAAAATAELAGCRVLVLEAHQAGGRSRTVERQGFILNMGAHALSVGGPGMAALRSLGVNPVGAPPPLVQYQALASGSRHLLPTGPSTLWRSHLIGRRSKAQLIGVLVRLPRTSPEPLRSTSMADWLSRFHLRPDAEAVVRALIRLSTYTDDIEALSADAGVAQLQVAARGGVLYLDGGWAQLIGSLSVGLQVRTGVRVSAVDRAGSRVEVHTGEGTLSASTVVLATGAPQAIRRLLPVDPGWGDLGGPVTAACLDLGVNRVPSPGYVLSLDDPIYVNVQAPPARQAPEGQAVVAAIRYGARGRDEDRDQLEQLVAEAGVRAEDVVTRRFLADMTVAGTLPRARNGGLPGRPSMTDTGISGVVMAGDWVGPVGLLADAALASGRAAGRHAGRQRSESTKMVG